MTTPRPIRELMDARARATIGRDDYWASMKRHHHALLDYCGLAAASGLERIEIRPEGLVVRDDDGLSWWWDPDEVRSPLSVLINDGDYEGVERQVLRALASTSTVVVDVGANIGWYAVRLALMSNVDVVHAFEPVPSTFQGLMGNIRLNHAQGKVRPYQVGLSDRDVSATLFIPKLTGSVAASERRLFDSEEQVEVDVPLRRLDSLDGTFDDVGLIKCDVEGGEFGFLRGAEMTLAKARPFLMLEMLRKWADRYGYHPNDIIGWMGDRGFRCYTFDKGVRAIDHVDETTTATNYLFAHEARLDQFIGTLRDAGFDVRID